MNNPRIILSSPTARLTTTYLAIIMVMSIGFSAVFYQTSANQLQKPLPRPGQEYSRSENAARPYFSDDIREFFEDRYETARQELVIRLTVLNLLALLFGTGISYALARKSLEPIEKAMESQAQFVSDASHELRTPLTVLQTSNEVALRKKRLSETDARAVIEHTVVEVKRLRDLTNSLLSLLHDSTPVLLGKTDIQSVVSDSLTSIVAVAQAKGISIKDTVSPMQALSNAALLTQVVIILLDNAIKYSPEHSEITISATKKDKTIRLSVIDKGEGIDPAEIPQIFTRFYRADKARTSQQSYGYGLGLSIAEKITKQLHATIQVDSTPGKGSTFTIVLPKA